MEAEGYDWYPGLKTCTDCERERYLFEDGRCPECLGIVTPKPPSQMWKARYRIVGPPAPGRFGDGIPAGSRTEPTIYELATKHGAEAVARYLGIPFSQIQVLEG
jgi:hypothetical protein